ncbi:aspartate aminotransferase family protein [Blastococcus sp. Marseille-P5729]|uniref:aspartate aminotransferase family protein n=1 Tax=Blastococcus sp. Marseille-P5729 TaxID=2086582 RepID=UPI000D0E3F18|nr:aspartate aminotransferase family protein [Blastococcus sp. Marseille-P5729]
MGEHAELLTRHKAVLPSWVGLYYDEPIEIVSGDGRHVVDAEGNRYLDFFAGILTNMLGYQIPEVNEAIKHQIDSGVVHTSTLYLIRKQIELAEQIADLSGIPDAKVFFVNSGTEANEAAMLLTTQKRRSNQLLALRNSYHGRSFGAMSVTGNRGWSASSLTPVTTRYVHAGYRLRSPFKDLPDDEFIAACVADLRDVIQTQTSGDVAAMIAEPIQGVGGFATPPDGFFRAMKEVLDEYGILFVSDEVQTGWGRTGEHFWGIEAHGVVPDAMTFAKGLGNGLAIGGVVAGADLMDSVTAQSITTFGGNPLSTAAAKATLDYVIDNDLQAHAHKTGAMLMDGLRRIAEEIPQVIDVRGKGLMLAFELGAPQTLDPDAGMASKVMEQTKRRGLLVGKGGLHGNVIRMAPPMTLSEDEVEEGLGILAESLADSCAT